MLAALGLAVLAQRAQALFVGVRFAGALYLLYLAWRLWRAPLGALDAALAPPRESALQLFLGALALTLGNPKTMVFFLAVLPTVVDLAHLTRGGFLKIAAVIIVVLPAVLGSYTVSPRAPAPAWHGRRPHAGQVRHRRAVMAAAAVAVATR